MHAPAQPTVTVLQGKALLPYLEALAHLRMQVFAEWPYLYVGDLDNEREYLSAFTRSPSSILVLAQVPSTHDAGAPNVVGVASAMRLAEESEAIRAPFEQAGYDPAQWFYLAESVLLPPYRGRGMGHAFFDAREKAGSGLGMSHFTFCAVERSPADPRRPSDARSLEPFWRKRGYGPSKVSCTLSWRERGDAHPTRHSLRFWTRSPGVQSSAQHGV